MKREFSHILPFNIDFYSCFIFGKQRQALKINVIFSLNILLWLKGILPLTFWVNTLTTRPQRPLSSHRSLHPSDFKCDYHYSHLYLWWDQHLLCICKGFSFCFNPCTEIRDSLKFYTNKILLTLRQAFANHAEWLHQEWGKMLSAIVYDTDVVDSAHDVMCTCWC